MEYDDEGYEMPMVREILGAVGPEGPYPGSVGFIAGIRGSMFYRCIDRLCDLQLIERRRSGIVTRGGSSDPRPTEDVAYHQLPRGEEWALAARDEAEWQRVVADLEYFLLTGVDRRKVQWSLGLDHLAALDLVARNAVPAGSEVSVNFNGEAGRWCVEAKARGEQPRTILLDPQLLARPDLDWSALLVQLRTKVQTCFADPAGCELTVEFDQQSPFGFAVLHLQP